MLNPGMHIDHYDIVNLIGEGTFGIVYRARDTELERYVALKVLKPNIVLMAEFLKRFQREARALAQFSHPNIVQIHRLSQWQDTWYLAMEYVSKSLAQAIGDVVPGNTQGADDGGTLVAAMPQTPDRAAKTLPLDDALKIIRQVCKGLREAHSRGIIHRDIKPENILLTDDGQVKVCDFGIAHVQGGTRLTTVGRMGTDDYGAPEQLFPEHFPNHPLDVRADVYAVCAVLYRLLAGVAPRPAGHPAPLSQFAPDVSNSIAQTIMRGLSWEPSNRYADLDALTQALTASIGPSIPPDLRDLWEAHAARLTAMGFSIPKGQELVIRNEKDDGIALWVPPGEFMMGSDEGRDNEKPIHRVALDGYYLDRHPVTNAQFDRFVRATGYQTQAEKDGWSWIWDGEWKKVNGVFWRCPFGVEDTIEDRRDHPVLQVSWHDAEAYGKWSGKRLPSEAQWEYAARGKESRKYPWGNTFDGHKLNFADVNTDFSWSDKTVDDGYARTSPVGNYPAGASPFGLLDMAGNVWEWCRDWYDENFYANSPVKNPTNDKSSKYKPLRGGSWLSRPFDMRCAYRYGSFPGLRYNLRGFRAAR